jgi:hypothetical protein
LEEIPEAFDMLWSILIDSNLNSLMISVYELGKEGLFKLHGTPKALITWPCKRFETDKVE